MLFAFNFTFIALSLLAGAIYLQGWYWLLLWPAASFGVVAAGYWGLGASIFGKNAHDGTTSLPRTLFFLPYLFFYWGFYVLAIPFFEKLRGERPVDPLVPGVLIGRRLLAEELPAEVTRVLDLTCEYAEAPEIVARVEYYNEQILDGAVPDVPLLTSLVDWVDAGSGVTYIHCAIGHGRTGLVACGLLLKRGLARDADDAIRLARESRPFIRLNATQRELLIAYHAALQAAKKS